MARRAVPKHRWKGQFVTPDRLTLDLDLSTYPDCCMAVGLYELDSLRQFRRLLKPGAWFVDCGANVGYFTLLAARLVGSGGRVDAFEPDPVNRSRLQHHLTLNNAPSWVRVHESAVGAARSMLQLYHPAARTGANHGMASAYLFNAATDICHSVPCVRLDEELDGTPDLIKIDIEGGELAAVEGLRGLVHPNKAPHVLYEHNPTTARAANYRPGDVVRRLLELRPTYRFFRIGWRLSPVRSAEELDRDARHGNILAVP